MLRFILPGKPIKVPGADAEGNVLPNNKDAAYFQICQEDGWLPAASVQKVSQYALAII